jgi:hypothetical protein
MVTFRPYYDMLQKRWTFLGELARKMDLIRGQVHLQVFSHYTWTDLRGAGHPTGESLGGIFCAGKLDQPFKLQTWKKG